MVQDSALFALDLDIVTNIFPAEDGGLLLNDVGSIDIALSFLECSAVRARISSLLVVGFLGQRCWGVSATEDKDFALALLRADELG